MSTRKRRIRPADEATSYILSSRDKPGLMEKFIDSSKGKVLSVAACYTCKFLTQNEDIIII